MDDDKKTLDDAYKLIEKSLYNCPFCGETPQVVAVFDKGNMNEISEWVLLHEKEGCPAAQLFDNKNCHFKTLEELFAYWNTRNTTLYGKKEEN